MTKKPTLTTVASGYQSTTMLNANLNAINNALDNTLSLDGSTPNNMTADIDLNSNDLLNVATTHTTNLYLGGSRVVAEDTLNTVSNMDVNEFTGDGSTVAYVLSSTPLTIDVVIVNVDGVTQLATSYTLSVATITFSEAPPLNSAIQIRYFTDIQLGSATSADLVSYSQGSTSHVTRTVESRLRDHVSVLDFGAVGDGVTNDTAALQAAINNAKLNGLALYIPGRTYLTGPLSLSSATKAFAIYGDGKGVTKFKHVDGNGTLIDGNPGVPVTLQGFSIDCQFSVHAHGSANHGISVYNTSDLTIRDVFVTDYKNSAILVYASALATYVNCLIDNCHCDGLAVANNGILITDHNNSRIISCSAKNCPGSPGVGIQFKDDCQNGMMSDNYSEACRYGLSLDTDGTDGPSNCVVTNMTVINPTLFGAAINYGTENQITNLYVDLNASTTANGVSVQNSTDNYVAASISNVGATQVATQVTGTGSSRNTIDIRSLKTVNAAGGICDFDTGSPTNVDNSVVLHSYTGINTAIAAGISGYIGDWGGVTSNSFEVKKEKQRQSLVIATGVVTINNRMADVLWIDTEGGAATDDLVTLTGELYEGRRVSIRTVSSARDVVVKHGTGNVTLEGAVDRTLSTTNNVLVLEYNSVAGKWAEISFSTPL